ncbi:response regulator transcription factor [Hyphomicrobium sp. NDB2Meth4]|jgi:DNA-binding NarL/FixJ family response regulator|uniref:response regulator transcription factor n=1 Tax=Hyphomicrobium sp. NDB2Meth4 TaxID=1892846 RepID=UPI000930A325|nr:response regulator transcription factor [Hyphomicrobium sp. NDB2Meth4]
MKLLVVDDHPVLREGLVALLRQLGPDAVVLEAGDAQAALRLVEEQQDLDVVILDLVMPGMNGLSALPEFGRSRPDLPVIVLSSSEEPRDARNALAQGALGYVPKSASQHTLISAIKLVLQGEIYVPPLVLSEMGARAGSTPSRGQDGGSNLTPRQIEVLRRLSEGQPNKIIAHELNLSEKTVKAHITAIFKALNVVNRTQAAAVGRESGLI